MEGFGIMAGSDDTAVNVRFCDSPGPGETFSIVMFCGPASSFTWTSSTRSKDGGSFTLVIVSVKSSVIVVTPSLTVTVKVDEPETFGSCVMVITPVPRTGTNTGGKKVNNPGLSCVTVTVNASS